MWQSWCIQSRRKMWSAWTIRTISIYYIYRRTLLVVVGHIQWVYHRKFSECVCWWCCWWWRRQQLSLQRELPILKPRKSSATCILYKIYFRYVWRVFYYFCRHIYVMSGTVSLPTKLTFTISKYKYYSKSCICRATIPTMLDSGNVYRRKLLSADPLPHFRFWRL